MRIDRLRVESYKNLQGFEIDLAEKRAMTVLIGENGSGKSNLFEAIVLIFRALDLDEPPPFAFEIAYQCRGKAVVVNGDPARGEERYRITVDDHGLSARAFLRRRDEFLPTHVFAYYSGPGTRLERLFRKHLANFDKDVRRGKLPVGELRRFFYCLPRHSRFVLLAYFLDGDRHDSFLREYFSIEAFDSVLLTLRRPWWAKKPEKNPAGNAKFWGAIGEVSPFLDELWTHALAPMRREEDREEDVLPGVRERDKVDRHYLYLPSKTALEAVARQWRSPKRFFAALDAIDLADLVEDVRIRVRCGRDTWTTFTELSEGEQQLLTVVGMLRFTQGEETLFLLDEPDTHLNPRWKLDYLDLLSREVGDVSATSQLLLSTHDPLTIASLKKDQVQIFQRDRGTRRVSVHEASEDPQGLGVAGVLTQMFGLPRTLDKPTLERIDRRSRLVAMATRTVLEDEELLALNQQLGELGLLFETRDPKVGKVLAAVRAWEDENRRRFWALPEDEQQKCAEEMVQRVLGPASAEKFL
jgi:predicted ATPase